MFDLNEELMLKAYFVAKATVLPFIDEKARFFEALGKIFLIPEDRVKMLRNMTELSACAELDAETDYFRYRRVRRYFDLFGKPAPYDALEEALAEMKGAAFRVGREAKLLGEGGYEVKSGALGKLQELANDGSVLALVLAGVLQSEGLGFERSEDAGLKQLRRAADWNDLMGLYAALRYEPEEERKGVYLKRLRLRLEGEGCAREFRHAEAAYRGVRERGAEECALLEKAFGRGILKRKIYSERHARVLYSAVLSAREKEAMLLEANEEAFSLVTALPLAIERTKGAKGSGVFSLPGGAKHEAEGARIATLLSCAFLARSEAYRPVCLVAESRYLMKTYAEAVRAFFAGAHVSEIEFDDLSAYDMEPRKDHVFLRSCEDGARNVFFCFFRGRVSEQALELAKGFLDCQKRGKFHLRYPDVTLDLTSIVPVCFSTSANARYLRASCDIVEIPQPDAEEKEGLIRQIFSEKRALYGAEALGGEKKVAKAFAEVSLDEAERAIGELVRDMKDRAGEPDAREIDSYVNRTRSKETYGFGGSIHEIR